MVKINILKFCKLITSFRHSFYVLFFMLLIPVVYSQINTEKRSGKKKIELKYADEDNIEKNSETGGDIHHFIGNVLIAHNDITMSCDSAHYYPDKNQVKAYSRVHIEQGDTLDLYGDYLFYDGKSEIAEVTGNVELIDNETHLFTQAINYDVNNKIARYNTNGRITNADNTLTSIIGVYYISESLFHFKDSVKIVNPDYVITADTMDYNSRSEVAIFTGPSELNGDSLYLYSERGWYDTKNDISNIWQNAFIDNRAQTVTGDSLFFNNITGFGESFRNVVIKDSANNLIVKGNYAWYYKQPERFLVTDKAMFIQASENDSLFLHADTISAITIFDTTGINYRLMRAFYGCRIFSEELQGKCDSLVYSFQDSVIRLYNQPVIWSKENQLTSDSMAIFTKNRQTDRLELYNSAFVVSQVDTLRYNQIKGRSLTGFFKNNELYKIDIKGNGESIYYLVEGEDITGINRSKCSDIEALVEKGKITEISDMGTPEGVIDPPVLTTDPKELILKGFTWLDMLRPKNKNDIFTKKKQAESN